MNRRAGCRESLERLPEYSGGQLDAAESAAMERHFEECPTCREAAAAQTAVWEALDGWQAVPVRPDFDRRLYRRIEGQSSWWAGIRHSFGGAPLRRMLPVAAAVGMALAAGVIMTNRPAVVQPAARAAVQMEPLQPDQAADALQDLEMLRDLNGPARPDSPQSKM